MINGEATCSRMTMMSDRSVSFRKVLLTVCFVSLSRKMGAITLTRYT